MDKRLISFMVTINGTDDNPYEKMGLTGNPFPKLGDTTLTYQENRLKELEKGPITDENHIKRILRRGFTQEFIEACCTMFEKGKLIKFRVSYGG